MQLSYRGAPYKVTAPEVEATETNQTGLFLGRTYPIQKTHVAQRRMGATWLKYRGVDYNL